MAAPARNREPAEKSLRRINRATIRPMASPTRTTVVAGKRNVTRGADERDVLEEQHVQEEEWTHQRCDPALPMPDLSACRQIFGLPGACEKHERIEDDSQQDRDRARLLGVVPRPVRTPEPRDRKSTRLNSSHITISYA